MGVPLFAEVCSTPSNTSWPCTSTRVGQVRTNSAKYCICIYGIVLAAVHALSKSLVKSNRVPCDRSQPAYPLASSDTRDRCQNEHSYTRQYRQAWTEYLQLHTKELSALRKMRPVQKSKIWYYDMKTLVADLWVRGLASVWPLHYSLYGCKGCFCHHDVWGAYRPWLGWSSNPGKLLSFPPAFADFF